MGKNIPGLKRGFHWDPTTEGLGIYVDGVQVVDYTAQKGRTYYVNNITGSSTGNGLSWGDAMDEPSTAITASAANRATHATNDTYILDNIILQGTATAYVGIVTLPSYCRFIGIGANPYGNGTGIPRLGADAYTTAVAGGMTGAADSTGEVRGMYLSGIQWQSPGTVDCFQVRYIFRSTIEDCAFFTSGTASAQPTAGIDITTAAGGLIVRDCAIGAGNASTVDRAVSGFNIGGSFTNSLVEDCSILGSARGVLVASGTSGQGSVFRRCMIGDVGMGACQVGIADTATVGMIQFQDCYINSAVDPIAVTNDDTRFVGCIANAGYVKD